MNTADKVIAIALEEDGYLEKSTQAYKRNSKVLDSKENGAGSDNYTKYGRDMHEIYPSVMDFPAYWCDSFVDWCFYKAYGVSNAKALLGGNFNDYTVQSAKLYKDKEGAWHTSNPKPGDQIFFKDNGRICHTGLVYKVDTEYVYTVEGNTSSANGVVANGGCVRKKYYSLTDSSIAGYGRPKYDIAPGEEEDVEDIEWKALIKELQDALNTEYKSCLTVDGIAGDALLAATPTLNKKTGKSKIKTVKVLQKMLTFWGYKCQVDGIFGTGTEKMVKSFQKEKVGLSNPDGEFTAKRGSWKVMLKL